MSLTWLYEHVDHHIIYESSPFYNYYDTYLAGLVTLSVFFFLFFINIVAITTKIITTAIISTTTTPIITGIGDELDDDDFMYVSKSEGDDNRISTGG